VGSWFKRRIDEMTPDALDVPETAEFMNPDFEFEAYGDLRYCAMSIDTNDHRLMGRRRTLYVLPWPDNASTVTTPSSPVPHSASTMIGYSTCCPRKKRRLQSSEFFASTDLELVRAFGVF
jgi:hypothetical protein